MNVSSSSVVQVSDASLGQPPPAAGTTDPSSISPSIHLSRPSPATRNSQWQGVFDKLTLSTSHIATCLQGNRTLSLNSSNLALRYQQIHQTNQTSAAASHTTGVCWLLVTTPNHTAAKLEFVEQTCSSLNSLSVWIQVNESFNYVDNRNGCEDFSSPLLYEYLGLGNWVRFGLVIQDPLSSYVVQVNVTGVARFQKTQLHVSSDIGIIVCHLDRLFNQEIVVIFFLLCFVNLDHAHVSFKMFRFIGLHS